MKRFSLFNSSRPASVTAALAVMLAPWANAAPMLRVINTDADTEVADSITQVPALIPVAKALIYPISAYSDAGKPLDISVKSSNPKIMARVRTGNPLLKMTVSHAAGDDPVADPAYTGTMVFQLFRDWTPITTGFIGGFAQAGFYDNVIFHRLANLTAGSASESFIYQGGNRGSLPGFNFENEFKAPLIFSGRGQLAMANAGDDQTTFSGTNSSQFFITQGNEATTVGGSVLPGGPRHLDFNHTIFAQLTHGWDVLEKLRNTPRTNDAPQKNVVITSTEVVAQYQTEPDVNGMSRLLSDAHLVLTATAPGTATITVTAKDGTGTVSKTFTATAFEDTVNSPPFIDRPIANAAGPANVIFTLPLPATTDLEFDYPILRSGLIDSTPRAASDQPGNYVRVLGNPGYVGPVKMAFGLTQFDPSYRGTIDGPARDFDDRAAIQIGIGDSPFVLNPVELTAQPSAPLTNVIVATLVDSNPGGLGVSGFAAPQINWGDGTAPSSGSFGEDFSTPSFGAKAVRGTHTYAKEGVYTVTVTLARTKGYLTTARSTVVVSAKDVKAMGETLDIRGARVANRVVATFTDANPVAARLYSPTIDWGDGVTSPGTVKAAGTGKFAVLGTHTYADPEEFSVSVRVHKTGDAAALDAIAWSRVKLSKFNGQEHLPPFAQAHLIGEISSLASNIPDPSNPNSTLPKPVRVTSGSGASSQTYFTVSVLVLNSGNLSSRPGNLRLYLSRDRVLNTADEVGNPRDIPLLIGSAKLAQTPIAGLRPGASVRYTFDAGGFDTRLRAPLGETGTGLNLLAHLDYSDRIADFEPIVRDIVIGPFNGISVTPQAVVTTEQGGQASFSVSIDQAPAEGTVLVLQIASSNTSAGTVSPSSITFTSADWQTPRQVFVTGVDNSAPSGNTAYTVRLTVDQFATTDGRFLQLDPADVSVTNLDDESKVIVSPTTITTAESGTTASFSVRLEKAPPAGVDVTIPITSNDLTEGTVSPATLTFNSTNFSVPQAVTVTGVNDTIKDGNVAYKISVGPSQSTEPRFNGAKGADVTVTNADND